MAVIPAAPAAALVLAALVAVGTDARWSRALAGAVAVGALAWMLATRGVWEYDVRRGVYLASRARGLWLDRGVELTVAAGALTAASGVRGSRLGFGVAAGVAVAGLACAWAARG